MRLLTHPQARFQGFFMPRTIVSATFSPDITMHLTSAMHNPGLEGQLYIFLQSVYSTCYQLTRRWQSDQRPDACQASGTLVAAAYGMAGMLAVLDPALSRTGPPKP